MTVSEPALAVRDDTMSAPARSSPLREAAGLFLRNPTGMIGAVLFLVILVATLIGPAIYGVDPFDIAGAPFMPPDADYWCGTDYLGRDIMAGLLIGGRDRKSTRLNSSH